MSTTIVVHRVEYGDVEPLRGLYRQEAGCQIVHDSVLPRGWADCYRIELDGRLAGYGGVWNRIEPGRLVEFYTLPLARAEAQSMYHALIRESRATHVEAQTNMPLMLLMFYDCAMDIRTENILFHDAAATHLACPGGVFRRAVPEDFPAERREDPPGEWVVELEGAIVATGGFLCHYNPPYGDIYMEVAEPWRGRGIGSFLVQELKRVCRESGKVPAARCNPDNVASRRTLQRAGLLPCARLLAGAVREDLL